MFSNKIGIKKHLNYLKNPYILEFGISSAGTNSTYLCKKIL